MQRSRIVVAALMALGLAGLGIGVAAAAGGGNSADAPGQAKRPTTTTAAPTTTTEPIQVLQEEENEEPEDDGVVRSTEGCNGGTYRNHGEYVSTVARTDGRTAADVVEAAHSDCGKPIVDEAEVEDEGGGPPQGPQGNQGQGQGGPPEENPGHGPGGPPGLQNNPGRGPK